MSHDQTLAQLRGESIVAERPCRYGRMTFLRTDHYMAQSLGLYGEFSESEIHVWRSLIRHGDTVVSAGANCGAHVVWFAGAVGPAGRVVTAEPQPVLFEILAHNCTANGHENVEAHRCALGASRSQAAMPAPDYRWPASFGSIGVHAGKALPEQERVVEVQTIDNLVGIGDDNVRLIHLDVEGFEAEALEGARRTIARCRPHLFVEIDRADARDRTVQQMRDMGYEVLTHCGALYNPANFAGNPLNVFGDMVSVNAFGIPRERR